MRKNKLTRGEKYFFFGAVPGVVVAAILGILLLVSMGGNNPTVETAGVVENPPPGIELPVPNANLNGTWVVEDNGTIFTATVTNNLVEITMGNESVTMLYWRGTFDHMATVGQVVTSDKMENGEMVMSRADSKEFVVGDNTITFDFTAMGMTKKVGLTRA